MPDDYATVVEKINALQLRVWEAKAEQAQHEVRKAKAEADQAEAALKLQRLVLDRARDKDGRGN